MSAVYVIPVWRSPIHEEIKSLAKTMLLSSPSSTYNLSRNSHSEPSVDIVRRNQSVDVFSFSDLGSGLVWSHVTPSLQSILSCVGSSHNGCCASCPGTKTRSRLVKRDLQHSFKHRLLDGCRFQILPCVGCPITCLTERNC